MRFYEFGWIDVQKDTKRLLSIIVKKKLGLKETISYSTATIGSFVQVVDDYSISESELEVGKYYIPFDMSIDTTAKSLLLTVVTIPAKYVGRAGSRFDFRYDTIPNQPLYFPSEEYTTENEHICFFTEQYQLDQMIQQAVLKFRGSDWNLDAYGYNPATSSLGLITNV